MANEIGKLLHIEITQNYANPPPFPAAYSRYLKKFQYHHISGNGSYSELQDPDLLSGQSSSFTTIALAQISGLQATDIFVYSRS